MKFNQHDVLFAINIGTREAYNKARLADHWDDELIFGLRAALVAQEEASREYNHDMHVCVYHAHLGAIPLF